MALVPSCPSMLEDGLTIPEVDALFGPALGRPKTAIFKTTDLVGLDTMAMYVRIPMICVLMMNKEMLCDS